MTKTQTKIVDRRLTDLDIRSYSRVYGISYVLFRNRF